MNIYDQKQRLEVGFENMGEYEFGGLEIDNQLTNGYQLYIPYGMHCDIFGAIQYSIQLMRKEKTEIKNAIKNAKDFINDGENIKAWEHVVAVQEESLEKINKNIAIFEKIEPLASEV